MKAFYARLTLAMVVMIVTCWCILADVFFRGPPAQRQGDPFWPVGHP